MHGEDRVGASEALTWNVVTVSYNSSRDLHEHWQGLVLPDGVRWTVVDNASADDSAEVARALGAQVIVLPRNVGFGAANNIGASSVASENVLFVNPDIKIDPVSLVVLEDVLQSDPSVVVAPQLINPDGTTQPSGRSFPTLPSKILNRLPKAAGRHYQITAERGEQLYVSWAIGAALAMRSTTFAEIRWDEHFFVYYEDSDLGLRAWKGGHRVVLDGSVRWVHSWARDTTGFNARAWRLELASMAKFYFRYPHLLFPVSIASWLHPERRWIGIPTSRSGRTA